MIELKLNITEIDFYSLIKIIAPTVIKNRLTAKAAQLTVKTKLKAMSEQEKNSYIANFLEEHKSEIIDKINEFIKNKGIIGHVCSFDAEIIK